MSLAHDIPEICPLETYAGYQRSANLCTAVGWLVIVQHNLQVYIPEHFKALAIWPSTHVYLSFGV